MLKLYNFIFIAKYIILKLYYFFFIAKYIIYNLYILCKERNKKSEFKTFLFFYRPIVQLFNARVKKNRPAEYD